MLDLEPGVAFGTGMHETTRLCLGFLEKYIRPGMKMLDVGCGSGILSIAALLLGAESAVGVDIDPLAVETAEQNAAGNHVEKRFHGVLGSLTDNVSGRFDLVTANIVADVIIRLTENVGNFMADGAVFLMSGIIPEREKEVRDSLRGKFRILKRGEENGWVALAAEPEPAVRRL